MSIIIHILICFIITVSNIYAFDLSTYKDNKDNTLEYQYYLLNKKDKDYIRLILQYDSDNFSYEDTISFYNNTIKHNSGFMNMNIILKIFK